MDESTVFKAVLDDFQAEGYETLVHIPSSHAAGYADVLEMAEEHTIIIAGKYPDIIGFSPTDEIIDQFDAAECD